MLLARDLIQLESVWEIISAHLSACSRSPSSDILGKVKYKTELLIERDTFNNIKGSNDLINSSEMSLIKFFPKLNVLTQVNLI